jgi:precorrin-2 dehydrogenase/sirohydrochlorin ferrochelatase
VLGMATSLREWNAAWPLFLSKQNSLRRQSRARTASPPSSPQPAAQCAHNIPNDPYARSNIMSSTMTPATAMAPPRLPSSTLSPPPTPKSAPSVPSTPSPPPSSTPSTAAFPPVQPGGSLLVAYQVRSKPVLVVGGGAVAAGRILSLLNADAHVHLVCPLSGCNAEVQHRIRTCDNLTHHDRNFHASLLHEINPTIVLTAIDDPVVSSQIYKLCHELRIPINVADVPPECDFYFGSVHRDGPLQVMVSTNGNGPKLANIVRRQIAGNLPENLGEAITRVGQLRKRLRKVAGAQEDGPRRMEWMSRVCEEWTLEELCQLGDAEMEALLEGYKEGRVVTLKEIRGEPDQEDSPVEEEESEDDNADRLVFEEAFEGSFGWF